VSARPRAPGSPTALIQRSLARAGIPFALGLVRLVATGGESGTVLLLVAVGLFQLSVFNEPMVERGVSAVVGLVVRVIRTVAAAFVFAFVLVGWLLHEVTRVDVLHRQRAATSGWTLLPRSGPGGRLFLHEEVVRRGRWRIRLLVVLVIMVVAAHFGPSLIDPPTGRAVRYHQFAFDREPWGREVLDEYHRSHLERSGALGWRNADFSGRYLNVDDTIRRSWTPRRPELTVWVFGGSAAFGVGQRDGHTIASELARLAAADGIRIRTVNFATPAYQAWQEALQLRTELSRRPAPDLVVLYHGANDLADIDRRASDGSQPLDVPGSLFERQDGRFKSAPRGPPEHDPSRVAAAEIRILRSQAAAAHDAAAEYDVPLVTVWQPSLWSMPAAAWTPEAVDAAHTNLDHLRAMHHLEDLVVQGLGPELVDLRHALDDAGQPTFFDVVHTNEAGARIVAEHLYPTIRPTLERLRRGR